MKFVNLGVFLLSLATVGAGVALKDPAWALVAVGGIGIGTTIGVSLLGSRQ